MQDKITLHHGSGGRVMHQFIKDVITSKLGNGILEKMDDSAIFANRPTKRLAMTTDSFVVNPLFFAGGDIGKLAICGTVNDLSCSGAKVSALSLAFILEDQTPLATIEKIVASIQHTANNANIQVVTGDTKVVETGKGDQIFINTTAVGHVDDDLNISSHNACAGDIVMVTRSIGNHEIALMQARGIIDLPTTITSDLAPLNLKTQALLAEYKSLHVIKDPTRGGVASALYEIAQNSKVQITINEESLPIEDNVNGICELLGLDPFYLANEGTFIIIGPAAMQAHVCKHFSAAKVIGKISKSDQEDIPLLLKTPLGAIRRLGMLETTQFPRIC